MTLREEDFFILSLVLVIDVSESQNWLMAEPKSVEHQVFSLHQISVILN